MKISQQLIETLYGAPTSLKSIKRSTINWMVIYFCSGVLVFSLFIWTLLSHEITIKNLILDYFFPDSWHSISEQLVNFFYEKQTKTVLGNLILSGSLVVASVFLFPIKEKFSAAFEKDAKYPNGPSQEFPLSYQAVEETRLFLLYIAAQSVILWIGYYPYIWAKATAITLSYLFLFYSFSLDIISPTLQRHRITYAVILKALFNKPLLLILFGLIFSLPGLITSKIIFNFDTLTLIEVAGILFLVNLIFLTLAIPAGTHLASHLLPVMRTTPPVSAKTSRIGYTALAVILMTSLFLHGQLIRSLHHKSQLLKAEYAIDWSSIDYKLPSFSQLLGGQAFSQLSFDIEINNPTAYDIVIEQSQIQIEQNALTIATVDLNGFSVPSKESHKVTIQLDSNSNLGKINQLDNLTQGWRVDIYLQVWPGIPLILNVVN
ncbi:hypothetical protein [Aliikangiella maris]|uniref:Uncharacterized protein n=2 Tax=Aliikangiella maris TaxID=3162458 RepID=A0ABV3MJ89_9GAMM